MQAQLSGRNGAAYFPKYDGQRLSRGDQSQAAELRFLGFLSQFSLALQHKAPELADLDLNTEEGARNFWDKLEEREL